MRRQTASRLRYLDNLKVVLISAVIAGHAVVGYSELDWWSYADVREVTLSPATVTALFMVVAPAALFVVPVLFLAAGLLTPPSLARTGTRQFVRDRLLRLGVPFAGFGLLLWPLLAYTLFHLLGNPSGLLEEGSLDTGVLWFVGTLLIFSLVIASSAGWLTAVPDRLRRQSGVATLVATATFAAVAAYAAAIGGDFETTWGGGWQWRPFVFSAGESALVVFGSVWLLAAAQRRLDRSFRWSGPIVSRSAYGALLMQGLVLFGLAVVLRPTPLPAEVKAVLVGAGGVAGSFALAWLLIRRIPGVARIL